MYTLEDDKETTSSLRKRDFDSTSQAPDGSGGAATGALHHPSLSTQVTSSFKKITTPAQPQAGGKGVALGALTIACIGVFFTTMDQTDGAAAYCKRLEYRSDQTRSRGLDYQRVPARFCDCHAAHGARL